MQFSCAVFLFLSVSLFLFPIPVGWYEDKLNLFSSRSLCLHDHEFSASVIEKMKCVWQRDVRSFALCVETA